MVSGSGGVDGVPGGEQDVVVAGRGGERSLLNLRPEMPQNASLTKVAKWENSTKKSRLGLRLGHCHNSFNVSARA